ncbi:MAG: DUF1697 domain-containing protein [Chloroflexi bacterium]|nr:DUF1697 domain-containing protein [Chloroflexota bacterium]
MQPDSPIVEARFVALLRGINVGGNKPIKMADLRQMFAALGYQNVKTALASGNVAWDAAASDLDAMRTAIATSIASTFGFSVPVLVLPQAQVQALVEAAPFAGIDATGDTRFYVTFLPEPVPAADPPAAEGLEVVRVTQAAVCSVVDLAETRTVAAMAALEGRYGSGVTTRTWQTVLKIAEL